MFIIKQPKDLNRLPPGSPTRLLLEGLLDHLIQAYTTLGYDPEDHGYVVLMEAQDIYLQRILPELPCTLADVPWEGVTLVDGFFHVIALTNNDFAIDFVIPDADWLSETIRASLQEHLW